MKNSKNLLIFFIILLVLGMTLVISFGLSPKPVEKIKESTFATPAMVAEGLYLILNQEISVAPAVFIGLDTNLKGNLEVAKEFLAKVHFDQVLLEANLPDIKKVFSDQDLESFRVSPMDLNDNAALVMQALSSGAKTLVIAPNIYTTQLIKENLVSAAKEQLKISPLSISFSQFPISRDEEKTAALPIACITAGDASGTGPLGCMVLQMSRGYYRKKVKGPYFGLLSQVGLNDYLFLMNYRPQAN